MGFITASPRFIAKKSPISYDLGLKEGVNKIINDKSLIIRKKGTNYQTFTTTSPRF